MPNQIRQFTPPILARAPSLAVPARTRDPSADEIALICHELRNSLGVVRNAAAMLRSPEKVGGVEGVRLLLERHVGQMSRSIEGLLAAARYDGPRGVLQLTHVDLRCVVESCLGSIGPELSRRRHRLVVDLPRDALWVHADVARLEQVFSNLLSNAAKYTPDGGEIKLVMERLDAFASVRVRDSGIGIAPEFLGQVFDLFSQENAAALCSEGGRGIGLAVVRGAIELQGGSVGVTSAGPGQGSEFTVLLPALWSRVNPHTPVTSER